MNDLNFKQILLLLVAFIIYSISSLLSKCASMFAFFSPRYFVCLVGVLSALCTYAFLWQKILVFLPLNKAFLCKSICILLVFSFSAFIFEESITLFNIIGAFLIILGLVVLAWEK